jgi:hypothetical protein
VSDRIRTVVQELLAWLKERPSETRRFYIICWLAGGLVYVPVVTLLGWWI